MIILDTNVTSELMMAQPDQAVIAWFAEQPSAELFSTVITIAEISYGLERLPRGQRRKSLEQSYESIFMAMADHILPFDVEAALLLRPACRKQGADRHCHGRYGRTDRLHRGKSRGGNRDA